MIHQRSYKKNPHTSCNYACKKPPWWTIKHEIRKIVSKHETQKPNDVENRRQLHRQMVQNSCNFDVAACVKHQNRVEKRPCTEGSWRRTREYHPPAAEAAWDDPESITRPSKNLSDEKIGVPIPNEPAAPACATKFEVGRTESAFENSSRVDGCDTPLIQALTVDILYRALTFTRRNEWRFQRVLIVHADSANVLVLSRMINTHFLAYH
jgi:hypothetical protein